ncbi:MAG TPA: TolC family protein [Longimicrobiales bacterium]|nr:TolC family protein [Longimicrobiales bacterium]
MRNVQTLSLGVPILMVAFASLPAAAQRGAQVAVAAADHAGNPGRPESAGGPSSNAAFWEVLNDPTLSRLLDEALRGNLELHAASARLDGAGASRTEAALELAPIVTAGASYTRRRLSSASFPGVGAGVGAAALPDQDLWDSGLRASWELDLFGRLRGGLRARNALLGSAGEEVRDAEVSVAADVARAYFDLRGAQGQLAVARRNAENQRRTLELTKTRLDAGRGTAFDTERARAQLSSTLAAIPALEARVAAMQNRIAVLVGRAPRELAADVAAEGALPEFPDSVPGGDPADVVRTRPDVLGAEGRLAASRSLVSSARADYLPRLSLAASAGYLASTMNSFGGTGTFNYTFGPVVSWPAFDLGRVKARVDVAQAQELEARARYEQVVLLAQEELETASVRYRTARARLGHLREAAAASERAASLARLRYEGGVADFLQVLDAERTLLAVQDQLAQAQTEVADAYVALSRARAAGWRTAEPMRRR